jgi:predicted dehydrogenase
MRDIARSGELGPVVGLRTTRVGWGGAVDDVDPIWHLAPHDVSIALEILGTIPPPVTARADHDGDDPVGLVAVLGDDPWCNLEVSIRSPARRREIRLLCRDGVAMLAHGVDDAIEVAKGPVARGVDPPEVEIRSVEDELPLVRELRAFVEHVQGGPPPRSTIEDSLAIARCIATMRQLAGLSPGAVAA